MIESLLAAILAVSLSGPLRALYTRILQYLQIILVHFFQALSTWLLIIARQPFSSLVIDFQDDFSYNCNSATQEHSISPW